MKKVIIISLVVIFFTGIIFLVKSKNILAEGEDNTSSGMESKLDKILKNQDAILAKLAAMSDQLDIIRVRSSRK